MEALDALDRKILFELDRNSRMTYSDIGKRVRAKKETVKYRMQQMIERKVIEGFYAVIDYSKLGFLVFRVYLTLEDISPEKREALLQYFLKNPNIWILYRTTGAYHFTFSIWVRDPWEYEKFWYDLIERYGSYIADYHVALVSRYTEFSRNYLVEGKDDKEQYTVLQRQKKEELDEIDLKLLQLLSRNARASLVEMAREIGTSTVTCRAHLKKLLEKKVIIGFRTMLNYDAIGYHYYKVDMWFKEMKNYSQIMQKVLGHPNVIYTERTLATSHFEFDLEVPGFEDFIRIMDGFEQAFPDDIRKYTYYTLIKNYKISYLPSL